MAPIVMELRKYPELECSLISTGQHDTMLKQTFASFAIRPDEDLQVMRTNQDLSGLTSRLLKSIGIVLRENRPDIVLVQGDTTTVLSATLAAFYEEIPVGHVEAGLRTYDFHAPWPEEMNRRLTDTISHWCFAPTECARDNLLREGIEESHIFVTGNTVIDALLWMREKVRRHQPNIINGLPDFVGKYRTVLVTGHRRESFGAPFKCICKAILSIVEDFPDVGIIYPVHLNPNVQRPVKELLGGHPRIHLTEPLSYEAFVWLMDRCYFLLTDSGGVQEEAPSLGKPVLVMRNTTERPEGVATGTVQLVGTDVERIFKESSLLLNDPDEYHSRTRIANPYGDGQASKRIVSILLESLSKSKIWFSGS